MKILGIWPEERKYNQASSYLVLLPISMMLLFINIPQTIDLYYVWGDIDLTVENLSVGNMTVLIAVLKTTIFWFSGGWGTYTSVDTFVVTLVFHACGQFRNLRQQLSNLSPENDYEFKAKLALIVKKHDSLNRFVNTIERQFNDMLLLQMLGCSIQICVTCFQALLSMGIVDAVYECKWYNLSPNQTKSLMIIMFRAQVPMRITAAKFCSFSHKLFGKINVTTRVRMNKQQTALKVLPQRDLFDTIVQIVIASKHFV
ncbi:odorant receptor 13a-like [Vespula squamosa]|uniref:Odorant receptor 13a-like n=1 Tax=Vespula squamosa TaxID=30214 RepID=A0ABD2A923_VESSQ